MPSSMSRKRARVIMRDGPSCFWCGVVTSNRHRDGKGPERPDDSTLDHIIPKRAGGSHGVNNFVLSCRRCNSSRNDRPAEDYLREAIECRPSPTTDQGSAG